MDILPQLLEHPRCKRVSIVSWTLIVVAITMGTYYLREGYRPSTYLPLFAIAAGLFTLWVLVLCALSEVGTRVYALDNISLVTDAIRSAFEDTQCGTIMQTFAGSNTIAGSHDFAITLLPREEIRLLRYFFITSSYDLNFAIHSLNARIDMVDIRTYIWCDADSRAIADGGKPGVVPAHFTFRIV